MEKNKYIISVWHKETPKNVMYVSKFKNGVAELTYDKMDAKVYAYPKCADRCMEALKKGYNDGLFGETVYTERVLINPQEMSLCNRDGADLVLYTYDEQLWKLKLNDDDGKYEYVLSHMRVAYEKGGTIAMIDPSGGPYITKGFEFGNTRVTYVVDSIVKDTKKHFAIIAHQKM